MHQTFSKTFTFITFIIDKKIFILDCLNIAGTYNDGSQNISYHNGDLQVHFKNSSKKKLEGRVRPSCEGYSIFPDSINKTFEYHEYDQKIV